MLVLDIGHNCIKAFHEKKNKIYVFPLNNEVIFLKWLLQFCNEDVFIGSVNLAFNHKIKAFFKQHKIKYYFFKKTDFLKYIKLNQKIQTNEIGLDILSMIYLINDQNYILINHGTAMTITLYNNQINGVIIGINYFDNLANLLQTTKLSFKYNKSSTNFANNTNNSFSSYINLFFIEPLQRLIKNNKIKKIYIHQIDKKYIKEIKGIDYISLIQPTLKGYVKLASNIKLK